MRFNSGNIHYCTIWDNLSSHLLHKTVKIKILETLILLVVLYVCNLHCRIQERKRSRMTKETMPTTVFGSKRDEVTGVWIFLRSLLGHNSELHLYTCKPSDHPSLIETRPMT
jgi:hypothetical protein